MENVLTDNQIVELFRSSSDRALNELQKKYGAQMQRIAESILADKRDAEECLNDVYLGACKNIPAAGPENLKAYLFRMTRNCAFKRLRTNLAQKRGGNTQTTSFEELSECIPGNRKFESEQDSKLKEQIEEFLRNLSKEKRAIFLGRFWFLYSVAEIAERLGRDEKYVSNQLYYLKKQFKKHLGRKEGYNERIGFTQSINRN